MLLRPLEILNGAVGVLNNETSPLGNVVLDRASAVGEPGVARGRTSAIVGGLGGALV